MAALADYETEKTENYRERINKEYPVVAAIIPDKVSGMNREWYRCGCELVMYFDYVPYGATSWGCCSTCGDSPKTAESITEQRAMALLQSKNFSLKAV